MYLHYVFDQWAQRWRHRNARGDMLIVRFADDYVAGFEHRDDADRFLRDLSERLARFSLELHPEKTRLIEFGRYAGERRAGRGLGKPETFDFLGFTHVCVQAKHGRFWVRRVTIKKRMRAKLQEIKHALWSKQHLPLAEQGRWLASVVRGHLAYYAVPGNGRATSAFRDQVVWLWRRQLRQRSQRSRLPWARMGRLATRWLPAARISHPFPEVRFAASTRGRSPVR